MEFLSNLGSFITSSILAIASMVAFPFVGPSQVNDLQTRIDAIESGYSEDLGRAVNPVGGKTYTLFGGGIGTTDTSITLASFNVPVSNVPFTMADFGTGVNAKGYLTIEPGSPNSQEFVSFTGITSNANGSVTLTGVSRGLAPIPPYTASTTYAKSHSGGSLVVISNPPQFYEAIYSYIDNATTSGAVDSSLTVKGIVELATGLQAASSSAVGSGDTTAPLTLHTGISTSTGPASGNVVPVTRTSDGNIDYSFLPTLSSTTVFTATTTYTKSSGVTRICVDMWGGGGSGGSGDTNGDNGSGGGGGAHYGFCGPASDFSTTTSIGIGSGGLGVSGDSDGNPGGATTFGSTTVYGGKGGEFDLTQAMGGNGGGVYLQGNGCLVGEISISTTSGNSTSTINCGASGSSINDGTSSSAGNSYWGGAGGGSYSSNPVGTGPNGLSIFGGDGGVGGANGTATAGGLYGGGGGGNVGTGSSGAGGSGVVRITEYFF